MTENLNKTPNTAHRHKVTICRHSSNQWINQASKQTHKKPWFLTYLKTLGYNKFWTLNNNPPIIWKLSTIGFACY